MRILVFSTAYYPFVGGAEVAIKEISDRLPEHEWVLITAKMKRGLLSREKIGAVTVYRVGLGFATLDKFLLPFLGARLARKLHREKKIDRSWAMMASQGGIAAALFKSISPLVPMTLTLQEGDEESYLKRYVGGSEFLYKLLIRPWYRFIFKKADHLTAISTYLVRRAREAAYGGTTDLVPNGVDLAKFIPGSRKFGEDGVVRLVHTGRLVEKNAVEYIIRALPLLPETVVFSQVGSGALEASLQELARELGVASRVTFHGYQDHVAVADLMRKADIFVRPSLSEGMGNSFVEAMAMRLPVVGTRAGGIADFLFDGKTGLVCESRDPKGIADAVKQLMTDEELRGRVVAEAEQMVRAKYSWEKIAVDMGKALTRAQALPAPVVIAAGIFPPDPGGPALHAKNYFEGLPALGVPTRLVAFRDFRKFPKGISHLFYLLVLIVRSCGARLIFAQDATSAGYPAYLVSRMLGKPLVVRVGGDIAWESDAAQGKTKRGMREWYEEGQYKKSRLYPYVKKVLGHATRIVVPTSLLVPLYEEFYGVPGGKLEIVPNPIDLKPAKGAGESQPFVLYASRMVAYKNLDFVLLALADIKEKLRDVRFIFCGDGPDLERLRMLVKDLGLDAFVEFPGPVSEAQVDEYTHECMITLAPALTEFSPNYLLRGIGYGKPFLISEENGLFFSVPGDFLFDPRNQEEFQRKLLQLLSSEGYKTAEEKIRLMRCDNSWQDVLEKISQILR